MSFKDTTNEVFFHLATFCIAMLLTFSCLSCPAFAQEKLAPLGENCMALNNVEYGVIELNNLVAPENLVAAVELPNSVKAELISQGLNFQENFFCIATAAGALNAFNNCMEEGSTSERGCGQIAADIIIEGVCPASNCCK